MTNAELAVLSLILEQPRHGYDIETQIEERNMRDWTDIGFSSIYAVLKKLEKKGWIQAETGLSVGQGAPRKVYGITETGRQAQTAAVVEALSTPGRPNSSLLLGLANIPLITRDQAVEALRQYSAAQEARLGELLTRAEAQRPLPDFVEAMFDYSTTMIATELAWLGNYIQSLENQDG
jgi:DNA-binding PadR family transcriptional regulator